MGKTMLGGVYEDFISVSYHGRKLDEKKRPVT
jgi:hypothetical protein